MRVRSRWRYLAPIALVAVVVAMLLVVQSRLSTKHNSPASNSSTLTQSAAAHHGHGHKRFYIVKAGDSLSTISVKTGVSVGAIEALNPRADPNALQTGERLRLRP